MGNMIIGISGFSNSGKTTLIERMIPLFKEKGLRVSVIKHDAHEIERDREEKDTFRFSRAGADIVMISSQEHYARFDAAPRELDDMLKSAEDADIVLIEGYKYARIRKLGMAPSWTDFKLPCDIGDYEAVITDDPEGFAAAWDYHGDAADDITLLDIRDPGAVSGFILDLYEGEEKVQKLTHFDDEGNARMVDVSDKDISIREAVARASVLVNAQTFELIKSGGIKKGDVLTVAQIAGIMGAKRTSDLIPMCHPIVTDETKVRLTLNDERSGVDIEAAVKCTGRTGVEMEAICACCVAAMTVYDMCKAVQRDIVITDVKLVSKSGGVHGDYHAKD